MFKMKKISFITILFLASFCIVSLFHCKSLFALEDTIIAVVNDDVITLKDLRDYLSSIYAQLRIEGRSEYEINMIMSNLEKNGINKLIEDKLIISQANELGMEIREDLIDKKLDEIRNNYSNEKEFLKALLSDGATITDLRNKIIDQMKIKYLVDMEVRSKIFVNPKEVTDHYKDNFEKYQRPERLRLESIYISSSDDPEIAKEKITKAYTLMNKLLKEGENFDDLVKEYSEGPSIGIVEKGQLLSSIEDAVFDLSVGDVSSIVEVDGGFYIFQVKERFDAEIPSLEDIKDEIYNKLFQTKYKKRYDTWLTQLEEDAFIEIKR